MAAGAPRERQGLPRGCHRSATIAGQAGAQHVRQWPSLHQQQEEAVMEESSVTLDLAVEDASEMRWEELVSEMTGGDEEFVNQCVSCATSYVTSFCSTDVFTVQSHTDEGPS
jgi:hypothetical protein